MIEYLLEVAQIVAPSFLIIGLGFVYNRFNPLPIDSIVRFIVAILLPAFAFKHVSEMNLNGNDIVNVFMAAWIILILPGLGAWWVFRVLRIQKKGLLLPVMFMNSVNLPMPILAAAYGKAAIPFTLIFYISSFIGIFTIGLLLVAARPSIKLILKEPIIYAMIAGLAVNLSDWQVPTVIGTPINLLEQCAVPMVLMVLGMQIALTRLGEIYLPLLAVALRMGGGLLAGLLALWLFPLEGLAFKVVLVEAVMPSAVLSYLVSEKYQADPELVASTILLSTVLALAVIPLTLMILGVP